MDFLLFNMLQGFFPSVKHLILVPSFYVSTERFEDNRSVSSVSSYVTKDQLSNLSFLIYKMEVIIHVSKELGGGLNEILHIKHSAQCLIHMLTQ